MLRYAHFVVYSFFASIYLILLLLFSLSFPSFFYISVTKKKIFFYLFSVFKLFFFAVILFMYFSTRVKLNNAYALWIDICIDYCCFISGIRFIFFVVSLRFPLPLVPDWILLVFFSFASFSQVCTFNATIFKECLMFILKWCQ